MRAFVLAAFVLAVPAAAWGASTVYGSGPAQVCYESARDGRIDQVAIDDCSTALGAFGIDMRDRSATLVNRGVIRLKRKEAAEALADFDSAIRRDPSLGEAWVNRGAALILRGEFQAAVESISKGIELGTEEPQEAYFNRAIAFEKLDDLPRAYADYRQAVALKPDWALPQQELARFTVTSAQR